MQLTFHGIPLVLHGERAVEVPDQRALIVADTHFGKSATFRANGVPVPEGDTETDLARLDRILAKTNPTQLIIAGDFLHASEAKSPVVLELLAKWFAMLRLEVVLIRGNHDRRAGALPLAWGHAWVDDHFLGNLRITHDPAAANSSYPTLAGHLHPVIPIKHAKGRPLRLPCFWQRDHLMVLPAFGSFTGGHIIRPEPEDQIYGVVRDRAMLISADRLASR